MNFQQSGPTILQIYIYFSNLVLNFKVFANVYNFENAVYNRDLPKGSQG